MPKRSEISFNEKTVARQKPKDKRYEIWDSDRPGLFLRVWPTGTKNYYVALDRKTTRKIGDARVETLTGAWIRAKQLQGKFADGQKIKSSRNKCLTLEKYLKGKFLDFASANQKTGAASVARLLSACKPLLKTRLDKLSEFQIEKWKAGRLKTAKPTTVKRDLAALKTALTRAVKWGIIDANPATPVKVKTPDDKRVRYLSDKERKRLLKALSARDKGKAKARQSGNAHSLKRGREPLPKITGYADHLTPLILLTMNTGLRRGEVLSLQWDQVNLGSNPRVTIKAGYAKSNSTRHVPLNSGAVTVMKQWKKQGSGESWVFPNPVTGYRIEKLKTSWPSLMTAADIQDFRFHDLRHDFASRLVMAGVDLYRVRDLLGHSSIQMTERYSHLAPAALAEAVEVLA